LTPTSRNSYFATIAAFIGTSPSKRRERYFGSQPYSIDSALSVWRFIASTHGDG
jgi:hypothetical protein